MPAIQVLPENPASTPLKLTPEELEISACFNAYFELSFMWTDQQN